MIKKQSVSKNNPCPFLRAMATYELVSEKAAELLPFVKKVSFAGGKTKKEGRLSLITLYIVALVANGISLTRLFRNWSAGIDIGELRNGPLDKKGAGSRIINQAGEIDMSELERLIQYAVDVVDPMTGQSERGIKLDSLTKMMDDNFERAGPSRRKIDRALMDGEWPVLLQVMGKGSGPEKYLSVIELRKLFLEREFPQRILDRLNV